MQSYHKGNHLSEFSMRLGLTLTLQKKKKKDLHLMFQQMFFQEIRVDKLVKLVMVREMDYNFGDCQLGCQDFTRMMWAN